MFAETNEIFNDSLSFERSASVGQTCKKKSKNKKPVDNSTGYQKEIKVGATGFEPATF